MLWIFEKGHSIDIFLHTQKTISCSLVWHWHYKKWEGKKQKQKKGVWMKIKILPYFTFNFIIVFFTTYEKKNMRG